MRSSEIDNRLKEHNIKLATNEGLFESYYCQICGDKIPNRIFIRDNKQICFFCNAKMKKIGGKTSERRQGK